MRRIFGNPGTTEIPLVSACERRTKLEYVVALSEVAAVPMADGYARATRSLAKMTYDAASGTVIYRSKMHLGLKRNFQVMPGAQWLELLCKDIPDR